MLSREQCRRADQVAIEKFHIPGLVLMENAGRNCAEKLLAHCIQNQRTDQVVVILCGPGNNGGDGFVIARHLYNSGLKVKVIVFSRWEEYSGDARTNLDSLGGLQMPVLEFDPKWTTEEAKAVFSRVKSVKTTWIVDAMLGTGAKGEPRTRMKTAIDIANSMEVRALSVDIPSGLDCDTGVPSKSTFRADITCTMIDRKIGFGNSAAASCLGKVLVVDIGAPPEILNL